MQRPGPHQRKRFAEFNQLLEIFTFSFGQLTFRVAIHKLLEAAVRSRG
jgi:hypothetical protein